MSKYTADKNEYQVSRKISLSLCEKTCYFMEMTSQTFYRANDYKLQTSKSSPEKQSFRKGLRIIFRANEESFRNKLSWKRTTKTNKLLSTFIFSTLSLADIKKIFRTLFWYIH